MYEAHGSIILVESDKDTRESLDKVLTAKGYRVEAFPDAEAAIERMDRGNSIALVVTDTTLPGMNGVALSKWVASNHPGVPVMFVTGNPEQVPVPGYMVLAKPVNHYEFLNFIWQHIKMGQMNAGFRELLKAHSETSLDIGMCIEKVTEVAEEVKAVSSKLTDYTREAADSRTKQDATIVAMGSRVESIGRAAEAARTTADNAVTSAANAHTKMDNLTLGTVTKNWKDKLDPFSLFAMTLLTGIIVWFASLYKDQMIESATGMDAKMDKKVAVVQVDIKRACEKVEAVDRGQIMINARISELDRGQASIDRKMDKLLWRLNIPDPVPVMRSVPTTH